jgi:hypothetical protein
LDENSEDKFSSTIVGKERDWEKEKANIRF